MAAPEREGKGIEGNRVWGKGKYRRRKKLRTKRGPLGPPWAPLGSGTGVGDHFPDLRVPTGFGLWEWGGDRFPDVWAPTGFGPLGPQVLGDLWVCMEKP